MGSIKELYGLSVGYKGSIAILILAIIFFFPIIPLLFIKNGRYIIIDDLLFKDSKYLLF